MHKFYLNNTEGDIIQGAQEIVSRFGGFPSMENGTLISVTVERSSERFRYDVKLVFDITSWAEMVLSDKDIGSTGAKICMSFEGCRSIAARTDAMHGPCGEIKFGDGMEEMRQDGHPSHIIEIPRPYRVFCIRSSHAFQIEFEEEECRISAAVMD